MPGSGATLVLLCLGVRNRNFQVPPKSVERPDPSGRTLHPLSTDTTLDDYAAKSCVYLFTAHTKMSHNYRKFIGRTPFQGET